MTHFYYYCFVLSNKTMRILKTFLNENKDIKELFVVKEFKKHYKFRKDKDMDSITRLFGDIYSTDHDRTNFYIYYDPYSDPEDLYLENNDADVYIEIYDISAWDRHSAIEKVIEFIKKNVKEEEYWIDSIHEGSFEANPIGKKSPISLICSKYIAGGNGPWGSCELKYFFN